MKKLRELRSKCFIMSQFLGVHCIYNCCTSYISRFILQAQTLDIKQVWVKKLRELRSNCFIMSQFLGVHCIYDCSTSYTPGFVLQAQTLDIKQVWVKKLLVHQLYIRLCFTGTDIRYQAGLGEEVTIAPVIYPSLFCRHRH